MTPEAFRALAEQGYRRIPVVLEALCDLDTPLSIYFKLANTANTYLLESVIGGERFGRYSIIGLPARERLEVSKGRARVWRVNGQVEESPAGDPLAFIDEYLKAQRAAPLPGTLRFSGGLAGHFSYDTVRYIEPRLANDARPDPLGLPDIRLLLADELVVVDNVACKATFIHYADAAAPGAYERAVARLRTLHEQLKAAPQHNAGPPPRAAASDPRSNIGEEAFYRAVARAKRYIEDGDVMQVQISQRLTQPFRHPPIELYRALRSINPSPYMFYFDFGDAQIVGASPEILVRREGDKVTLRPIAGTRKRGATPERDRELELELVNDPKERAEHLMLIDLGRNDIGRIAKTGTVRVTDQMVVERYSHVMHLVSNVEGEVDSSLTPMGLLRATFPAGTVTGAPKVRSMEIIDELEPERRGVYAGAVGYLGFNGNLDLAIAIRTGVVKSGELHAQAAAGIVADSIPENEWLETRNKTRALLAAAERVHAGLEPQGSPVPMPPKG